MSDLEGWSRIIDEHNDKEDTDAPSKPEIKAIRTDPDA